MANSGSIDGPNVSFGGAYGYRTHLDWQLASQNVGSNFSTINWQAYAIFYGGAFSRVNDGVVNSNVGTVFNQGGTINNRASGSFQFGSGSFNVGHDGAGNAQLQMNAQITADTPPISYAPTTTWQLPTIPRYAGITFFNQQATDEAVNFQWGSTDNVDYASWWSSAYDGGGHHDFAAGGTGPFQISLHNLQSEKAYDITVAVRRADSGLWTTSGTAYPTTLKQSNFITMRVP